ncbi:MAG: Ig-like domain-containing protein [Bacteroidota bacterium]
MRLTSILFLISVIYILAATSRCANPINPSGGPRDTIPPTLMEATPSTGTILYQEQTMTLTFDEFINADKLRQDLIITPQNDIQYKPLLKKNRITIEFEEPFQDSITYTFNFFNSITDITEKNPAKNLVIAFSTGPYIDSLVVTGSIADLLTQKPQESIIAALYPWSDTLDYSTDKPMYFASSDEKGNFKISYIKTGNYKLLAFQDDNNNLLLESQTEAHGFLPDSIPLTVAIDSINLTTFLLDIRPLSLLSARPFGAYFQARYNKPINSYSYITPTDSLIQLYSRMSDDQESIQFYPNEQVSDSLQLIVSATDTTQTTVIDTMYLRYTKSTLRSEDFLVNLQPGNEASIQDQLTINITANKPIKTFRQDLLLLQADTVLQLTPDSITTAFNFDRTSLDIEIPWTWQSWKDSLETILYTEEDSTQINPSFLQQVQFLLDTGAIVSITNDSSIAFVRTYREFVPTETGILSYQVNAPNPNAIVELIDDKYETIATKIHQLQGAFTNVPPGKYGIRILLDTNQNQKWDVGNLNIDQPTEPIFVMDEFTELRANWEVEFPPITLPNM